jgi:hypothetical protein
MKTGKTLVWVSAGMISLFAFANSATADTWHFGRYHSGARHEIRGDRREIWKDRAELRRDTRELYKDKAELRRDLRRGAPASEIAQDRSEIRQDLSEIFGDRRDLRGDFGTLRRDRSQYGWNNNSRYPYNPSNYSNNNYGWWDRFFGR